MQLKHTEASSNVGTSFIVLTRMLHTFFQVSGERSSPYATK